MPVLPPAGTRLVLMTEDLPAQLGTRTEDGDRLSFEWGEPDQNGWYTPTITRTPSPPPDADEVLFLTSAERVYRAFAKWYKRFDRHASAEQVHNDAVDRARELLKHLEIPTTEELAEYRREHTE